MDYEKMAQELFEMLLTIFAGCGQTEAFDWICRKYPPLLENYERKIETEIKDVSAPDITDEEARENISRIVEAVQEGKKNAPASRK